MKFCAVEHVLPTKRVTNEDMLEEIIDKSKDNLSSAELDSLVKNCNRLFKASWTSTRYHRADGEDACQLIVEAGKKALDSAQMFPEEIDLLIYVGVGRGFIEPSTANVFHDLLGLKNATCFDILDACMSWLRALDVSQTFLTSGKYKNIMIINGEFSFREYVNFEFKSVKDLDFIYPSFTIGEAATATILSRSERDDEYYAEFKSWGGGRNFCMIPLPNFQEYGGCGLGNQIQPLKFFSYGEKIFKFVAPKIVHHYRKNNNFNKFKHDIVFTHAASDEALHKLLKICHLGMEKGYYTHNRFGNTVSASVPLAMSHAAKENKLEEGKNVILAFGSAGVSTAWCKFKYLTS